MIKPLRFAATLGVLAFSLSAMAQGFPNPIKLMGP